MSGDLATSLREVWDAKKNLRHTLKVPKDIPFNKYIDYYPWLGEDIPEDGLAYDFTGNRYSQEGVPVLMGDISEFIRLSSATKWHDGQLVEVQDSIPRISSAGLLVEKSATELIPNNSTMTSINTAWAVTDKTDPNIGSVFEFVSDGSSAPIATNAPQYPNGNVRASSGHYYRSILAKKASADSFLLLGSGSGYIRIIVNLKNGSLEYVGVNTIERKITEINEYYLIETLSTEAGATERQFRLDASDNRGSGSALAAPTIGYKVTVALPSFMDTADFPQSVVETSGTQVTRSPDILNIPRLPTQAITGDWDAGVTYTVSGSIATFAGHGYIHNIDVVHNPISPFKGGEKGFWIEPYDSSTLFQDSDGTIPVVDGDPIGLVLDRSGNNYHLTQTVSASRPKLLNGGIAFDKVDDALTLTVPEGGITGTLFLATTRGTASYGVSIPAGVWTLGGNTYNPVGDVVSAVLVDRVLTEDEKARLHVFGVGKGGTEFGVETVFARAFQGWTHLVDFPLIDASNGTNFILAWGQCTGLTAFPLIDVSSATSFSNSWNGCSKLETFPANFFDNCLATVFNNAFTNTKLSQESIDGILVSINSNATSNGTFNQSGGSAPSIVGQAAIDAMRARGWTVTTTGGY